MTFNKNNIIIDHNIDRICDKSLFNYVAHVLCLNGMMEFSINEQHFLLNKGECMILIVSDIMNIIHKSKDLEVEVVYVTQEFLEVATPKNNYGIIGTLSLIANPVFGLSDNEFNRLLKDFKEIEYRINSDHLFLEDVMICQTQQMFLDFFDPHAKQNKLSKISVQNSSIMTKFMEMLDNGDYVKHRDIAYYADKLCITSKYLSELSKQISGKSANYWINRFTTIHIRRLLNNRDISFVEISDMFEFSSPSYFSRFVQRNLGAPPSAFRQ